MVGQIQWWTIDQFTNEKRYYFYVQNVGGIPCSALAQHDIIFGDQRCLDYSKSIIMARSMVKQYDHIPSNNNSKINPYRNPYKNNNDNKNTNDNKYSNSNDNANNKNVYNHYNNNNNSNDNSNCNSNSHDYLSNINSFNDTFTDENDAFLEDTEYMSNDGNDNGGNNGNNDNIDLSEPAFKKQRKSKSQSKTQSNQKQSFKWDDTNSTQLMQAASTTQYYSSPVKPIREQIANILSTSFTVTESQVKTKQVFCRLRLLSLFVCCVVNFEAAGV